MKRIFTALLSAVLLSACGFQLRGEAALPFSSLYLALPESHPLRAKLTRRIHAGSKTVVAASAKESQAILGITGDNMEKNVLALNSAGRVREYELVRIVAFRVYDPSGRDLIAPAQIVVKRDFTFDDSQILAKQAEESLLVKDMEDDLVQQLMRRLAAAKPEFAPSAKKEG